MCIYGDLNIIHLQGATTNEVFGSPGQGYYNLYDRKGLQIMVSALLRIRKQYGVAWFFFHLLAYWFTIPVFFIGVFLALPFKRNAYSFKQFRGYARNCVKMHFTNRENISLTNPISIKYYKRTDIFIAQKPFFAEILST